MEKNYLINFWNVDTFLENDAHGMGIYQCILFQHKNLNSFGDVRQLYNFFLLSFYEKYSFYFFDYLKYVFMSIMINLIIRLIAHP